MNHQHQTAPRQRTFRNRARAIIPGIITAAIVFGPSKITITSKMGASYGNELIWVIVAAIFLMIIYTDMATRIAGATDVSLLTTIRNKWGRWAAITVGIGIFLVTTSFQAGNAIGTGIAVAEITHTPPEWWITVFTAIGLALLFFRSFYAILEKLMIALIILMLLAFCITLVVVRPGPGILSGLVPSVPAGSSRLIIAFTASCFSLVAAFYQAYLVHERKKNAPATPAPSRSGSRPGILLLGILILTVMLCAAAALHIRGIEVHTAQDMARALEPLFGSYAAYLFLIGLFGASFSSLIGNATVGGTLLGDALSGQSRLDSGLVRSLIAVIMIAGAVIAIIFGKVPLEAIVIAQSITIFIVPVIGLSLLALGNDKQLMGHAVNTPLQKTGGIIGLCVLLLLATINVRDLFF